MYVCVWYASNEDTVDATYDGNKLQNFTPQRGPSQEHTVRLLPPSGSPANTNDHSAKYRRNSIGLRQIHRLMACLA